MDAPLKILLVCAFFIAGFIIVVFRDKDPWNSHNLGPGWECGTTSGGAAFCTHDVPPELQSKQKMK
ncbi:hypothetical protein F2P47_10975 [Parvibaculum sedimenti]|uniref:Uncharacterized protein n=1 Tax=Parvibaculum sedimenti TaxID=2608632 RepID=A0A6N6VKV5_9HYPH|nr:hypothetical protein [Parvibaculum sedimenti]KAB7739601.1 hypothetical protein F2P47_10975 [Parvibaculum sedimenti]